MNKEDYTFEEKVVWLSNFCRTPMLETTLHPPGLYEWEINKDFEFLYRKKI